MLLQNHYFIRSRFWWAAENDFGKTLVSESHWHLWCVCLILQSLIPLKEEWDMKSDEKKTSESYRLVCEENKEVMEVSGFILCLLVWHYLTCWLIFELKYVDEQTWLHHLPFSAKLQQQLLQFARFPYWQRFNCGSYFQQVILKNMHLKEIINHLRRIIWEINTMLTMRRSWLLFVVDVKVLRGLYL